MKAENNKAMNEVRIESVKVLKERKNETTFEAVLVKRSKQYYFKGFFYKERSNVERSTSYFIGSITKRETKNILVEQFKEVLTKHFVSVELEKLKFKNAVAKEIDKIKPLIQEEEAPVEKEELDLRHNLEVKEEGFVNIEDVEIGKEYLVKITDEDFVCEMVAMMRDGELRFGSERGNVPASMISTIEEIPVIDNGGVFQAFEEVTQTPVVNTELIDKLKKQHKEAFLKPIFNVSLVYKNDLFTALKVFVVKDARNKEEALGIAIYYYKNDYKDYSITDQVVTELLIKL